MKRKRFLLSLLLSFPTLIFAQKADDILGEWLAEEETVVEVFKENDKYYGKIAVLKEPLDENGNPKTDNKNKDSALKGRKILGMVFLSDFTYNDGTWENGKIYDAREGNTYDCEITISKNNLYVRGYLGLKMFGKTVTWTRVKKTGM